MEQHLLVFRRELNLTLYNHKSSNKAPTTHKTTRKTIKPTTAEKSKQGTFAAVKNLIRLFL
jgi:hypothetical protein